MDVRALRYFVETVRHANFTAAAKALFVTQSTVSKMIRQLEDELGTPLLIRDGHTARPTDAGRLVFERAVPIISAIENIRVEVDALTRLDQGALTVGLPPMINVLFSHAVRTYRASYPGIELKLVEAPGPLVEAQVRSGELEIGATLLPLASTEALTVHEIGKFPIHAIGPESVSWHQRRELPFSALRDQSLLTPTDDFALTQQLRAFFAAQGVTPHIAAQSAHWDFLIEMAAAGLGIALIPEPLLQRVRRDGLAVARVTRPGLHWSVAHISAAGRYLSFAARAWLEVCSQHFAPTATH